MQDFRELFAKHGAPNPHAVVMETEVRSEGALAFQHLTPPGWAANLLSSSSLSEWTAELDANALRALQTFLVTVDPASGKSTEELINEAFVALDIGYYLGTFIEQDVLVGGSATIRVLFSHRSKAGATIEQMNLTLFNFLQTPTPAQTLASGKLRQLRQFWEAGAKKDATGLMMLSQLRPLFDPARFPYTAP